MIHYDKEKLPVPDTEPEGSPIEKENRGGG
jgi:hypothetical protein